MSRGERRPIKDVEAAMPAVLVMVRHGHSEGQEAQERAKRGDYGAYTEEFRNTPTSEWKLTARGFRQAKRGGIWLAEHLVGSPVMPEREFDASFVSSHVRPRQTLGGMLLSSTINPGGIRVKQRMKPAERLVSPDLLDIRWDTRLRELDFGAAATLTREEYERLYPDSVADRRIESLYGRTPGGESIADVMDRFRLFMGALRRAHERGVNTALIVGHGRQITAAQLLYENVDPLRWQAFEQENVIGNVTAVALSRRNPEDPTDVRSTYCWTSVTSTWQTPDQPPIWREFDAQAGMTQEDLLEGVDPAYYNLPPAGPEDI